MVRDLSTHIFKNDRGGGQDPERSVNNFTRGGRDGGILPKN